MAVPSDIAGLVFWVRTDSLSALADTDPIDIWDGEDAGDNDLTQAGTSRPLYQTNEINGRAIAQFDGSNDFMGMDIALSLATTHTVFAAVKPRRLSDDAIFGGAGNFYMMYLDATNIYYRPGVGAGFISVAHGMSVDTAYMLAIRRNGTTVRFYKNGSQIGTDQTLSANENQTIDRVGSIGGASFAQMDLGEAFIHDSSLSDGNVTSMFDYLNGRWVTAAAASPKRMLLMGVG